MAWSYDELGAWLPPGANPRAARVNERTTGTVIKSLPGSADLLLTLFTIMVLNAGEPNSVCALTYRDADGTVLAQVSTPTPITAPAAGFVQAYVTFALGYVSAKSDNFTTSPTNVGDQVAGLPFIVLLPGWTATLSLLPTIEANSFPGGAQILALECPTGGGTASMPTDSYLVAAQLPVEHCV